jgi:hypothetical protein
MHRLNRGSVGCSKHRASFLAFTAETKIETLGFEVEGTLEVSDPSRVRLREDRLLSLIRDWVKVGVSTGKSWKSLRHFTASEQRESGRL